MLRILVLPALLWGLVGCKPEEPPEDYAATIDALNATIAAHEAAQTSAAQVSTALPSPTVTPRPTLADTPHPTLRLSTPQPVMTIQRPPTVTPTGTATPQPTPTATATPLPDAAVGDQLTNLRSGPSVGFAIIAEVEGGTALDVLGKSADGEWLKVRTPDGLEGWMFLLPLQVFIPLDTVPITQ